MQKMGQKSHVERGDQRVITSRINLFVSLCFTFVQEANVIFFFFFLYVKIIIG